MNIAIKAAIVHVLDSGIDRPVLSGLPLELRPATEEYLYTHLENCLESDNAKAGYYASPEAVPEHITAVEEDFVAGSKTLARAFFTLMRQQPGIARGDLVCVQFENKDNGSVYWAALKMNYHEGLSHFYSEAEGGAISLIAQQTLLPAPSAKVDEAFLVDLANNSLSVIEKKVELDGAKDFYLSTRILNCQTGVSSRAKLSAVKQVVKKVDKELYGDSQERDNERASVLYRELSGEEEVTVDRLCQELYREKPEAVPKVLEGLREKDIPVSESIHVSSSTVKRLEKQALKSTSGIEIKIPVGLYQDAGSLEFINNPDGTISLLIKNVML